MGCKNCVVLSALHKQPAQQVIGLFLPGFVTVIHKLTTLLWHEPLTPSSLKHILDSLKVALWRIPLSFPG